MNDVSRSHPGYEAGSNRRNKIFHTSLMWAPSSSLAP